jgi:hypothetical protein
MSGKYARGFSWSNRAWYADANRLKYGMVHFGIYHTEGGTSGEMTMEWDELCGKIVPQLKVYNDGWKSLSTFKDVIDELGKVNNVAISDTQFVSILKACGFEDLTEYE